jgi:two-component system chemotaxis response regulator CheB
LIVRDGRVHLGRGPAENGSRPAIDPLFRSLADGYGPAAIGVVLSGALDDGTGGLHAIKTVGGITVVQDPEEALYPSMPKSALAHVAIDHVAASAEIPGLLGRLVAEPMPAGALVQHSAPDTEVDVTQGDIDLGDPQQASPGQPSSFACPDCHGVLWEIKDGELTRFRCRVGHAYLPQSLAAAQSTKLEEALWTAMRTLRESASLAERLAARASVRKMPNIASAHERRAADARERARVIEAVLKKGKLTAEESSGFESPVRHLVDHDR